MEVLAGRVAALAFALRVKAQAPNQNALKKRLGFLFPRDKEASTLALTPNKHMVDFVCRAPPNNVLLCAQRGKRDLDYCLN